MAEDFRAVITHPTYSLPFLQAGRLVRVKYKDADFGWGVVINFQKRIKSKVSSPCSVLLGSYSSRNLQTKSEFQIDDVPPHEQYILDVLLCCQMGTALPKDRNITTPTPGGVLPCPPNVKGDPLVVPVLLSTVEAISHIRIFLPKDLRQDQARETVWKSVLEVQRRFPEGITLLDPVENMGIKDERFLNLVKVRSNSRTRRPVAESPDPPENRRHGEKDVFESSSKRPSSSTAVHTVFAEADGTDKHPGAEETNLGHARHFAVGGTQVAKARAATARFYKHVRHR